MVLQLFRLRMCGEVNLGDKGLEIGISCEGPLLLKANVFEPYFLSLGWHAYNLTKEVGAGTNLAVGLQYIVISEVCEAPPAPEGFVTPFVEIAHEARETPNPGEVPLLLIIIGIGPIEEID